LRTIHTDANANMYFQTLSAAWVLLLQFIMTRNQAKVNTTNHTKLLKQMPNL